MKNIQFILGIIVVLVVIGGVYYMNANKDVVPNTNQQSAIDSQQNASTTQVQGETVGWKTYINEKYGFEIKYPIKVSYDVVNPELTNFYYASGDFTGGLKRALEQEPFMNIFVEENQSGLELDSWVREKWNKVPSNITVSINSVKFNNLDAIEHVDNAGKLSISLIRGENVYSIYYNKYNDVKLNEEISQILSTFEFIK